MTSRIRIENGVLTARLDDKGESQGQSDRNLPGHLPTHPKISLPIHLPKPAIMQTQYTTRRVDDIKTRFEKIISEYNDHQHLLSRYKEGKQQQIRATNYSKNQQQQPMVHNTSSVTQTRYSLREGQIINLGNRLETDDSNPTNLDNPKHPQDQHIGSCVSKLPPPPTAPTTPTAPPPTPTTTTTTTTTTTKPDIDETDSSRADFLRRKIQQFDKAINSCSTPGIPKERKKCIDADATPSSLEKVNNRKQDDYTASFAYLLDQYAKQKNEAKTTTVSTTSSPLAATKESPRKNPVVLVHKLSSQRDNRRITRNCLRINLAGEVVITANTNRTDNNNNGAARISSRGFPAIQQGVVDPAKQQRNDPPIRLNETMSTCLSGSNSNSSREVPMGGLPSDETDTESASPGSHRTSTTIRKTMVMIGHHRSFCLRRLCMTSGIILLVTIALFGVGIVLGYLSYTIATK